MATAKQKKAAANSRANAVKALKAAQAKKKNAIKAVKSAKKGSKAYKVAAAKLAKVKSVTAKKAGKVRAISRIVKEETTAEATTSGSLKHTLAKIARDEAKTTRSAAVKKMQDLKPKSKAWQKARRNVVTASSDVRKQGNVMRGVSGRDMGQYTSYTGPRDAMRKYIQDVEASKGGKALTKLGDKTEFTQINQIMLSEMPGKTYADKRKAWDEKWGQPGSKSYKDMQDEQAERHSEMINDPDYDPDFVPKIFDNLPTGPTGPLSDGILGPSNPTVPSFGYPAYQDWTRFMPTNFQLAEGAGMHYQPWATGLPAVSAGTATAGPGGTVRNTSIYTDGPGVINPNIWGNNTASSNNITTDTSGNQWVMSPGGQWVPANSDYGKGLTGKGRLHGDPNFYDQNGMYVGAEGLSRTEQGMNPFDAATGDYAQRGGLLMQDASGNLVKRGFSSRENILKGITLADEAMKAGGVGYINPSFAPSFEAGRPIGGYGGENVDGETGMTDYGGGYHGR